MNSLLTVTTAETAPLLTTLARVKRELNITSGANDVLLNEKLAEASGDIAGALGYTPYSEIVSETFWPDPWHHVWTSELFLRRTPVAAIASVTLDGTTLDASEYRYNAETGQLFRLDGAGYPCHFLFCKAAVVAYTGGWILPANQDAETATALKLPAAIEGATVDLLTMFWKSRGRDASVRSIDIPGVRRVDYWVGSVRDSDPDLLPPDVLRRIAPFRRMRMAVA